MEKIIKNQIVDNIYEKSQIDKEVIQTIIEDFLEEVKNSLKDGNSIEIRGFGSFEPKLRKGKENARNPKTGETVSVPPHYIANFKPGKELKQALWDLKVDE